MSKARQRSTRVLRYMLSNMAAGCCFPWPYNKVNGYAGHIIWHGKVSFVCRVVCTIAQGAPPSRRHEVRHLCGKGNLGCFNAECLVWGTKVENEADKLAMGTRARGSKSGQSNLTEDDVLYIRRSKSDPVTLARRYRVTGATIYSIRNRTTWRWL